jgi:hypothetical protein
MADVVAIQADIIPEESSASAVAWGAILAGGVAAAAFSLFLIDVVAGLGLVLVSPWSNQGASASTLSVAGGIAMILMAVMASALGGYIAGRLRTRWTGLHTDETYFRDSAHGFLAWAVGTIILATVLASAAGVTVAGVTAGAAANPGLVPDRNSYFVDTLFRSNQPVASSPAVIETTNAESARLLARALAPGAELTADDRARLAQLVAARTGLSQQEAQQRVDQTIAQAKEAADHARKAAAKLAFWIAASLLAGGLAGALGAIEGGREREA